MESLDRVLSSTPPRNSGKAGYSELSFVPKHQVTGPVPQSKDTGKQPYYPQEKTPTHRERTQGIKAYPRSTRTSAQSTKPLQPLLGVVGPQEDRFLKLSPIPVGSEIKCMLNFFLYSSSPLKLKMGLTSVSQRNILSCWDFQIRRRKFFVTYCCTTKLTDYLLFCFFLSLQFYTTYPQATSYTNSTLC